MDLFFKKSVFPSIEDFAKDVAVKKNLTTELKKSIQIIQEENVGKSIISDNESSTNLCYILEAIFIHGLKDKLMRKMSSVFSSGSVKMPSPQFWSVACSFSHKNVILEINHFNQITTDIGRGRAWLRCALNDGLIVSYVGNLQTDTTSTQKHYNANAYLLDKEQSDIMKKLLEGLNVFTFELSCNSNVLNLWNSLPLSLANVWTPPVTPQPVMPAVDVIDFFTDPKNSPRKENTLVRTPSIADDPDNHNEDVSATKACLVSSDEVQPCSSNQNKPEKEEKIIDEGGTKELIEPEQSEASLQNFENIQITEGWNTGEDQSKVSSSDSIPNLGLEIIESDQAESIGNRLSEHSGWSSAFDDESPRSDPDQSYDSLLQSYNKNLSKGVIGTPELADSLSSYMKKIEDVDDNDDSTLEIKSPDLDFEIVPKYYADSHADEETKKLRSVIGQLCLEQGLDAQNFQCNSCGRAVGLIYGKARLCHYDGYNYCYECHENDEEIIPAKIVHNWDFKKYPVSKRTKAYLSRVIKDPLLNIKLLNPAIYTAVEEMAQMQLLRTQLTFLRSYLFTCKEDIANDLRKRIWPREYLMEHVHTYSVDDLLEIPQGLLSQALQKLVVFAKNHVMDCKTCHDKGFYCEICKKDEIIYPFDIETTYHCDKCLTVYHAPCMEANSYCLKCVRLMKRNQQRMEKTPE